MNAIVYVGPFILNHLHLCLTLNILAGVVAGWALRNTGWSGMFVRMTFVAAEFMSGPIGGRTRTIPAPKV